MNRRIGSSCFRFFVYKVKGMCRLFHSAESHPIVEAHPIAKAHPRQLTKNLPIATKMLNW